MTKNLVYYSVGINPEYSEMLIISLDSLIKTNPNPPDILIITDKNYYENNLIKLKYDNLYYHFVEIDEDPNTVAFNRLKIFEFSNISEYDKIIYLDVDTIVNCDIEMFFKNLHPNKLNVVVEDFEIKNHQRIQFSLGNYNKEDISFFEKNKIYTFNSGTFMFQNSLLMKKHFTNVLSLIENHDGEFFTDQSFMNYYFNTYALTDVSAIRKGENYYYIVDENINNDIDLTNKIMHFIGNTFVASNKLKNMKFIYDKIFINKKFRERSDLFTELPNIIGPSGRGVEIGVFKGDLSKELISKWNGTLYMVDVWRPLGDEYDDMSNHSVHNTAYSETMLNIRGNEDRAIMIRCDSKQASEFFQDESLDFIYIDANHAYDFVKEDLYTWFPKLKKGGIFSGHDYINMDWYNDPNFLPNAKDKYIYTFNTEGDSFYHGVFGVNPAVDEFCKENGYKNNVTEEWFGTWWFIKR